MYLASQEGNKEVFEANADGPGVDDLSLLLWKAHQSRQFAGFPRVLWLQHLLFLQKIDWAVSASGCGHLCATQACQQGIPGLSLES